MKAHIPQIWRHGISFAQKQGSLRVINFVGFGGLFSRDPLLIAASSPRAVGYGSYALGRVTNSPVGKAVKWAGEKARDMTPYIAQLLSK